MHLPRLYRLKEIDVIQWVPGAGAPPNGPDWMKVYKQIQSAGKSVHISMDAEFIKEIVEQLDPSFLYISTNVKSISESDELLKNFNGGAR